MDEETVQEALYGAPTRSGTVERLLPIEKAERAFRETNGWGLWCDWDSIIWPFGDRHSVRHT